MARKKLGAVEGNELKRLESLVPEYFDNKEEEKAIKKVVSEQNEEIKKLMSSTASLKTSDGDYVFDAGSVIAKLSERLTKSLNEEKLIEVIKKAKIGGVVKTKEYIDMEALEDLMYKGLIPADVKREIAECEEVKRTPTLTVKASKKKED